MQIGSFGSTSFGVSSYKVLTFKDFKRNIAPKLAAHEVIGAKPILEFVSPGAESINMNIEVNQLFNADPDDEFRKLQQMAQKGTTSYLVIGGKPIGDNPWAIESVEQDALVHDGMGNIVKARMAVTLKEAPLSSGGV